MKTYVVISTLFFATTICCVSSSKMIIEAEKRQRELEIAQEKERIRKLKSDYAKNLCENYLVKDSKKILDNNDDNYIKTCRGIVIENIDKRRAVDLLVTVIRSYKPCRSVKEMDDVAEELRTTMSLLSDFDEETAIRFYSCVSSKPNRVDILTRALLFANQDWWKHVFKSNTNYVRIRNSLDIEKLIERLRYKTTFKYMLELSDTKMHWNGPNVMAILEFDARSQRYAFEDEHVLTSFVASHFGKHTTDEISRAILRSKHLVDTPRDIVKEILKSANKLITVYKVPVPALCSWLGQCRTVKCINLVVGTIDGGINRYELKLPFDAIRYRNLMIAQSQLDESGDNFLEKFVPEFISWYNSDQNSNRTKKFDDNLIKFMVVLYRAYGPNQGNKAETFKVGNVLSVLPGAWDLEYLTKFIERAHNINLNTDNYRYFFSVVDTTDFQKAMNTLDVLKIFEIKEHGMWILLDAQNVVVHFEKYRRYPANDDNKICINSFFTNKKLGLCGNQVFETVCEYGALEVNKGKMSKDSYQLLFNTACGSTTNFTKLKNALQTKKSITDFRKEI